MYKLLALLFILSCHCLSNTTDITIVTEQYPPYNYQEEGVIKGMSSQVVQAVLHELDLEVPIKIYPWARAYRLASTQKNVLIYSISRIPQRETQFKWVGVIAPISFSVLALKKRDDLKIHYLQDLQPLKIGTVLGDALDQYFTKKGFKHLMKSNSQKMAMKVFLAGRSDVWPTSTQAGTYLLKSAGLSPTEMVREVLVLEDFSAGNQYMAFSLKTDDSLVNHFKEALYRIKQKGIYKSIIDKYKN